MAGPLALVRLGARDTTESEEPAPDEARWRGPLADLVAARWGSGQIVSRDRVHDAAAAHAVLAVRDDALAGAATWAWETGEDGTREAELVTLDALVGGVGVGSALVEAVADGAREVGAHRLVVSTTNDNMDALAFYQRRGFRMAALQLGAVDRARLTKPVIPLVGSSGIEIHDELVLARDLRP